MRCHLANSRSFAAFCLLAITGISIVAAFSQLYRIRRPQRFFQDTRYTQDYTSSSRYLTYSPHSGFHNQRIALENAFILAHLLNRTLIVPPIRFSKRPIPYRPYDELRHVIDLSIRPDTPKCPELEVYFHGFHLCTLYSTYTTLEWRHLFNFEALRLLTSFDEHARNSGDLSERNRTAFNYSNYILKDSSLYEYKFYDVPIPGNSLSKYQTQVLVEELEEKSRNCSHLSIGTLFGTGRVRLDRSDNLLFRSKLRRAMSISNPLMNELADRIAKDLGGRDSFHGVHLRLGNGFFADDSLPNSEFIWRSVLRTLYGIREETIDRLGSKSDWFTTIDYSRYELMSSKGRLGASKWFSGRKLRCPSPLYADTDLISLNTPLFVATDLHPHSMHPALTLFRKTFPCIFFMDAFSQDIEYLNQVLHLDGSSVGPQLAPLLEAMVLARAAGFVGTSNSTFSRYIQDILWPVVHDRNVL